MVKNSENNTAIPLGFTWEKGKVPHVHYAIYCIMRDVDFLVKNMNVGSGNFGYKGVGDAQVKNNVREQMIKHGIHARCKEMNAEWHSENFEETDYKGNVKTKWVHTVKLTCTYEFISIVDGSTTEQVAIGFGLDNADKHDGKAMTYAQKNALMNIFVIPSFNENDKDATHSNQYAQPSKSTTSQVNWFNENEYSILQKLVPKVQDGSKSREDLNNWLKGFKVNKTMQPRVNQLIQPLGLQV